MSGTSFPFKSPHPAIRITRGFSKKENISYISPIFLTFWRALLQVGRSIWSLMAGIISTLKCYNILQVQVKVDRNRIEFYLSLV